MELSWRPVVTLAAMSQSPATRTPDNNVRIEQRESQEDAKACLVYLEKHKVVICREHATGVQNLDTHLRDHHKMRSNDRKALIERFDGLRIKLPSEVRLPPPGYKFIAELGDPLPGFQCAEAGCDFLTVSIDKLRMHCKKDHDLPWRKADKDSYYKDVLLQTFFRTGGQERYFVVRVPEPARQRTSRRQENEVAQLLVDWQEKVQEHKAQAQVMEAQAAKTDKTGWFNRTGWPEHFAGRNRTYLALAAKLPGAEEKKLQLAVEVVEKLIEQCVVGLSSLPRETRRWLKSAKASEIDQRPLARLQNPESQARYARYIGMFVCYFLRIAAADEASSQASRSGLEDVSDSGSDCSSGQRHNQGNWMDDARELFPWQGRQKELAQALWEALDEDNEGAQLAALLEVLAAFIFEPVVGSVFHSGLVQFTAVLGIDLDMDRLRTAKNYSYMLAGIVYCVRVIGVEWLLPAAHRGEQGVEERERFLLKRQQFLADGSYSPMSEMLSLLAYGKFIAMNAGNSGNVFWSKDKKVFHLGGKPIRIADFQQMAQNLVTEAEDLLWELLWVENPGDRFTIRLDLIRDDVTFTKRGWSFVTNRDNGLDDGLPWMLKRLLETEQGRKLRGRDGAWNKHRVRQYLRRVKKFLEVMLVGVHVTSGQPARGPEITTMRHRNGVLQDRNIFVVDGQVMTVVRYYKSQSQWDKPKVVPRFLPRRLGRVMVLYLAYLRPLQEYLEVQVLEQGFSDYVWANEQGPWETDRLTRALKRETGKVLGVELNTLDYRHSAVGIGRVVVGESFSRGYQDEVGEVEEAEVDDDGESPLELQSSRTTQMGSNFYSVPIDIIKHLSTRSMEAFRPLSEAWHFFLGLGEDDKSPKTHMSSQATPAKRRREMEAAEHFPLLTPQRKQARPIVDEDEELLKAVERVVGSPGAGFKSAEQEQATHAVMQGVTPLVIVLPTGGGKTLVFTAPACLRDAGVTIVVVPFRALIEHLVMRITRIGIDCMEWKHGETNPATIVVVSADVAGSSSFLSYAGMLSDKGLLRRVVVDECHLIFTASDWRPKLGKLKHLRVLACPIVLLTATLPPVLEAALGSSMLVRCATYIRASTVRPNIRYLVSWCGRGKAQEMAVGMCKRQAGSLQDGRKGVVYCKSKAQCEALAEELDCGYYHAGVVDRAEKLEQWLDRGGFIVATSALGTGVDFPDIVFILHVGMPWSMIDFAQESGRGGRGGELVDSVVMIEEGEVERGLQRRGQGEIDVQAMGLFIQGQGCRRGTMSEYLDGKRVRCSDIASAGCDRCGEGLPEWQVAQREECKGWQKVEEMMGELRAGCAVCWVMGEAEMAVEEDFWRGHGTLQCSRYQGLGGQEVDDFRRGVRDSGDCPSCRRCWVSQKWCATGERAGLRCQWPNVVIPVCRAAVGIEEGLEVIRGCGYDGEFEESCREYGIWLGRKHRERVFGERVSNAMAVAVRMIERLSRE